MKNRAELPTPDNSSNFNTVPNPETKAGTTLENLKAAVCGETGASAKYAAYSADAEAKGYKQAARLWAAASAAEQVHIRLESGLVAELEEGYERPAAPVVEVTTPVDVNLIDSAYGEMAETSDMYPEFIKAAQAEGNAKAVQVFTKAKLAESVHAEMYLDAYNNIDAADDTAYYLCPACGYIHKGEGLEKCPICGCPFGSFKQF